MKLFVLSTIRPALIALLLSASMANGSDIDLRRHVEVDATAELLIEPDFATFHIKIRGEADSLAEASKRLEDSSTVLKTSLAEAGFAGETIRLSAISSGRHFEGSRDQQIFKGFFAERSAILELRDLSKRQALEEVLLRDDRIEISSINAQSSQHDELRKQVLLDAAAVAKEKAAALAKALDAEIGTVLAIRQGNVQYGFGFVTSNRIGTADNGVAAAELEKLSYQASVSVKFELK